MAKVIYIALVFWLPLAGPGQTITTTLPTRLLTMKDGLPARECGNLFKDSKGFLWFSTKGGVCRYDGKNILAFTKKDGFDNQFHSFTETTNGTIVVSAKGHLMLINGLDFRRIELPIDATQNINCVLTKPGLADSIFVITESSKVLQYLYGINLQTGRLKLLKKLSLPDQYHFLRFENEKLIFLASLTQREPSEFVHPVALTTYASKNLANSVSLAEQVFEPTYSCQNQHTLISPSSRQFQTLVSSTLPFGWKKGFLPKAINIEAITQFLFVNNDTIFLANKQGVWLAARGKALLIDKTAERISDLLCANGQLFVSSDDGLRIHYLHTMQLQHFDGIDKPALWCLSKKPHSNILTVGSFDKKLIYQVANGRYKKVSFLPHRQAKSKKIEPYYGGCWFPDAQANIIPLNNGICTIDAYGNIRHIYIDNTIFQALYDSSKRCVYLAGYGNSKLYRLNKNLAVDTLSDGSLYKMDGMLAMVIDKQGNVLVSSSPQPAICRNGHYESSSLFPKKFWGADRDYKGNLWFACGDTVFFSDYRKWTPVIAMNPLSTAISIKCYFDRYVFIGTINGLTMLDLEKWYEHQKAVTFSFDESNGFMEGECRQNGFLIDDDSTVLLPHELGIVHFDPRNMDGNNSYKSASFSLDKINIKQGEQWRSISYHKQSMILQPEQRSIRIQFAIASLSNRSFINVRYRLKGLDSNWTMVGNEPYVTFERLPPGQYSFEVQSSLNQQDWKNYPANNFEVKAFYWETRWFQALLIMALSGIIAGAGVWAYRRKKRIATLQLERRRKINELQLEAIKSKTIAHFSKNVFSQIDALIELGEKRKASKYLSTLSALLHLLMSDSGKPAQELRTELECVRMYLELEKLRTEGRHDFLIEVDNEVNPSIMIPNMAILTYAENAIKHGLFNKPGNGLIFISVKMADLQTLLIQVEDDGIGRKAALNFNRDSTKMGLKILTEQLALYNSFNHHKIIQQTDDVELDNEIKGTRFSLLVPTQFHFTDNQTYTNHAKIHRHSSRR